MVVPRTSFKVTQGEWQTSTVTALTEGASVAGTPSTWDGVGDSGKINKHFFCPTCGSGLYTELEIMPDVTCIKAGGLDGGKAGLGNKVDVEFYCKDRVGYLKDVPEAKQLPAFS